jgi:hypothetical protein
MAFPAESSIFDRGRKPTPEGRHAVSARERDGRDPNGWPTSNLSRRHVVNWRMGEEAMLDLAGAGPGAQPRVVGRYLAVRTALLANAGVSAERRRQEREDAAPYVAVIAEERERAALERLLAAAEAGPAPDLVEALLHVAELAEARQERHSAAAARRAARECGVLLGDPAAIDATIRELARLN